MSWKDRATAVDQSSGPNWKTRATPVSQNEATPAQPANQSTGNYWVDAARNAVREVKGIVASAPQTAKIITALTGPVAGEIPTVGSIKTLLDTAKQVPGMLVDTVTDTAKTIRHPINSFREKPINTLMTAASLLDPAVRGVRSFGKSAAGAVEKSATANVAQKAAAKASNVALGIPEEAMLSRMKDPNAVKTAFSHAELADQMVNSVKNFQETLSGLAEEAGKTLRSSPYIEEGAVPKTDILKAVKSARQTVGGAYTPDKQAAVKTIKGIEQTYKQKLKSTVSESQIKERIQELDANINWDNPASSKANEVLISLRTKLDGILKGQNPSYKEAMVPVDEATRVYNKIQQTFGIKRETGRGFSATDSTVGKIQRSLKEDKLQTQDVLDRFQKISGEDWTTKIRNANSRSLFEREGRANGARRVGFGFGVGEALGNALNLPPTLGGALGSSVGFITDIYGPKIASKVADVLASPKFSRYTGIFEKAAAKGAKNVVATHALLMETDPKYAAAVTGGKSPASVR